VHQRGQAPVVQEPAAPDYEQKMTVYEQEDQSSCSFVYNGIIHDREICLKTGKEL
jgi:hypothetical protein